MFGVGYSPPPLSRLDRLIFTPQTAFQASITLGAFFVTFLLLLFAGPQSVYGEQMCFTPMIFFLPVYTSYR